MMLQERGGRHRRHASAGGMEQILGNQAYLKALGSNPPLQRGKISVQIPNKDPVKPLHTRRFDVKGNLKAYYGNISKKSKKVRSFYNRDIKNAGKQPAAKRVGNPTAAYRRRRTEIIGEVGGLKYMQRHNLEPVYVPGPMHGRGIDMIGWDGRNMVVIECKGPSAKLSKEQMSKTWVEKNLKNKSCSDKIKDFTKKNKIKKEYGIKKVVVRTKEENDTIKFRGTVIK